MLCDDLEGWEGGGCGREAQEEGDVCTHKADSLCGTAETNTSEVVRARRNVQGGKQSYSNNKWSYCKIMAI